MDTELDNFNEQDTRRCDVEIEKALDLPVSPQLTNHLNKEEVINIRH